jgi:sterol desaturase/sphingolipid hydroxylase (fatty acid hydroxylase superfamily)
MFSDVIHWYTAHAAVIFVLLVGSAILLEQVGRRLGTTSRGDEIGSARTSLVSGLAFIAVKGLVSKLAVASLALFVYDHFRLFTLDLGNPWIWVGVFAMRDFIYYWVHRAEHRIRLLWASHMVHHSPQSIGFTTAVRVPWMEAVYKPWLGLWVPLIGFHPVAAIALDVLAATMAQMYHTRSIRQIPVLERIFVTPSTHRVHHGSNPEYIDKNFGAVFIVWDHLFGTFEPEVAPVRYGIGTKRIDTPVKALVGGYPALVSEMRAMRNWSDRARYAVAAPT